MDPDNPSKAMGPYARAQEAARFIRTKIPEFLQKPHVGIICGSGLGAIQHAIEKETGKYAELAYQDIPNFPQPTVQGHEGKMVFGVMGKRQVPVVLLVGRAHFYEGHNMELVTLATRVCKCLDVRTLVVNSHDSHKVTNAAGGTNPSYAVGDIVLLSDHLNIPGFTGANPLLGANEGAFGLRFPPMSDAYDLDLRRRAHRLWSNLGLSTRDRSASRHPRTLQEGTYAFATGPNYETRAEGRLLRGFGADVVGMSTVPEVLVARHAGLRVLAMSLVTNNVVLEPVIRGDDPKIQGMSVQELDDYLARGRANHEEVIEEGRRAASVMVELVKSIVEELE